MHLRLALREKQLQASSDLPSYDANLVAQPRERMEEFTAMAARQAC
jgi:hypothetical protein